MKKLFLKFLTKISHLSKKQETYPDIKESDFWEIYNFCKPYTMTSVERMYALYSSVNYILSKEIPGSFVECGVWRGGSAMLIAKMLAAKNITDRKIYLYDTFEGMSVPSTLDVSFKGDSAKELFQDITTNNKEEGWCLANLTDVKQNMETTGFLKTNMIYVKGKVEDTLPASIPAEEIALLRLDTDWYESTKHELNILFPMIVKNGVLIIDDYGHWEGCRKAVDEYIEQQKLSIFLQRVDYTARIAIKQG